MVFMIFWTSIFAILFFSAGIIFRLLTSAINAFSEIAFFVIEFMIADATIVCGIAILEALFTENFKSVDYAILIGICVIAYIVIITLIIGAIGGIANCICAVLVGVLRLISKISDGIAIFCDDRYIDCLKTMIKQVEERQ